MCLGIKETTGEVIAGSQNGGWLTRTVWRKTARERWERSNVEMIVAVPWRKNEDDAKMDGERQKGEVVMMDNDYKEKLETEEHVQVPKRMYITREDQEAFGFTARCPGCMSSREHRDRCKHKTFEGGLKRSCEAARRNIRTKKPRRERNEVDPGGWTTTTTSIIQSGEAPF